MIKVTLIAGGVGGAKLAEGLAAAKEISLSIIGNIADDDEFHGLWVSPDIDTMLYTLSEKINRKQGWGVKNDDYKSLNVLKTLGSDTWMSLGDKDIGLHIYRTQRIKNGDSRSLVTSDIARAFNIKPRIILPTDDIVKTKIKTPNGWLSFQEYFVKERCKPEVKGIKFSGIKQSRPSPKALKALKEADLIIIAPSNPLVSIAPILGVPEVSETIKRSNGIKIAISPLIDGKAVKGPAETMMRNRNLRPDSLGIAEYYSDLIDCIMIDKKDFKLLKSIEAMGLKVISTNTLMVNKLSKIRVASKVIFETMKIKTLYET